MDDLQRCILTAEIIQRWVKRIQWYSKVYKNIMQIFETGDPCIVLNAELCETF